ncbi:putative inner membrane transporter yiJE [Nocardioides dokdonensis FR1436]|uniref:Putative inner membrane transporter yiJE n=1 Tax=Nocardioides dokdonensis FR1436 TaxID=1300347 RepID=A0A1A9GKT8_9ACTN|nr:DMT family transporter [Nocardioides dokdonensis]ANH38272.1 putative inner membrane transporter yiJE [Nocardioides dokdonensis FR1436]
MTHLAAPARPRPATWLPPAAVATTLVLWASAFVAIRHLGADFSAGPLSLGRLLVGALCLAVVALSRGLPHPTRREWVSLVAIGLLWFGVYNVALNEGEQRIDAGTAAMLIQLSPVLVALLAVAFLDERFTAYLAIGLALAFGGVALIGLSTSESQGQDLLGVFLVLLSAVVYAISLILQKPLVARLAAVHVTWLACTIGAVACLPFLPTLVDEVRAAPTSSVLWVVYLGVFPTAIAFTTYAYALTHMDASRLAVTTYLVPPITIGLGWALLGETPPGVAYVGGALALIGVAVARRKPRRMVHPPAPA